MPARRAPAEFSLSFLDVICCGFGAVILLLMITKAVQPQVIEQVMELAANAMKPMIVKKLRIKFDPILRKRGVDTTGLWDELATQPVDDLKEWFQKMVCDDYPAKYKVA